MNARIRPMLAAGAVTALAAAGLAAGGAVPAVAGGDGHHHGYDVTIPLTERASNQLRDGHNQIAATGKADKWSDDGRVVLSFPVAGDGDRARHDDGPTSLKGGIAYVGAGPNITWDRLQVTDKGVITAVLRDGTRAPVLKAAGDRHHSDRGGDHGGLTLVLTSVGAASLNNAAQGAPFDAGDVFAGGNDCH